ncbi:MAG TPA: carbohydrate ABC transporter permease [Anaerolineaceae bacterium]
MTATATNPPAGTEGMVFERAARTEKVKHIVVEFLKYFALIVLSASFFFPLYWMAISALKDDPQVYTIPPILFPNPMHWENFPNAWTLKLDFNVMTINTIFRYCIPVTLATVLMSTVVAYGFSRIKWKGRNIFFYICMGTMMMPWQVTMVPLFILYRSLKWTNSYLPLVVPSLFGSAYFIFLLRQFMMTIPEELSDAARIDGANELGILFQIMLPLMTPALTVVALFRWLGAWNDYLGPLIYLNRPDLYPLALGVNQLRVAVTSTGTQSNTYPYLMAVSTIIALPILLLFFFAQRTFIEGISLTGIKG